MENLKVRENVVLKSFSTNDLKSLLNNKESDNLDFLPYNLNNLESAEYDNLVSTLNKLKQIWQKVVSADYSMNYIDMLEVDYRSLASDLINTPSTDILRNIRKSTENLIKEYAKFFALYNSRKHIPLYTDELWKTQKSRFTESVAEMYKTLLWKYVDFISRIPNISYTELFKILYNYESTEGYLKITNSNGNLHSQWNFNNSILSGLTLTYYKSGKLAGEWNFEGGKLGGISRTYYESGKLKSELDFKSGAIDGLSKKYWDNGIYAYLDTYDEGVLVHRKSFDREGKLKFEQHYKE